jgi:hypothetical protein
VPGPVFLPESQDPPAALVKLDLHAAFGSVELERGFVGRLKLVEGVVDHHVAVAGAEVDGVLDGHLGQHLVAAVTEHAVGGADDALDPIRGVRERILNGAAAHAAIAVISLRVMDRVRRPAAGKILPAGGGDMADGAELAAQQKIPGLLQDRVAVEDVGDGGLSAGGIARAEEAVDAVGRNGERFFNQDVPPLLQHADGHGYMQVRRRTDHAGVKLSMGESLFPIRNGRDAIGLRHGLKQGRAGITGGNLRPSRALKAAQMTLANAAATDD